MVTQRLGRLYQLYRLGGLSRTTVFNNGLPTSFSTPEMGLHKLSYSPLREPLAEASFETIPWWPVLALNPGTGQVEKRYLPKTTAANIAAPTGPNAEPTYRTASYTYYPGHDIRAGRLQSQTETATGGISSVVSGAQAARHSDFFQPISLCYSA